MRILYWYSLIILTYVFIRSFIFMVQKGSDIFGIIGLLTAPIVIFLIKIWKKGKYDTLDK